MKSLDLIHVIGEGQEGLYLDGEQIVAGEDVRPYIKGVLHGLACMGWDRSLKQWEAKVEYAEEINELPEYLDEFDEKRMKKKRINWGDL